MGKSDGRTGRQKINEFRNESLLRIKLTLKLSHATSAGLNFNGQSLLNYDMNFNTVNGTFYSPNDMTSMEISADIFIDKHPSKFLLTKALIRFLLLEKIRINRKALTFGEQIWLLRIWKYAP